NRRPLFARHKKSTYSSPDFKSGTPANVWCRPPDTPPGRETEILSLPAIEAPAGPLRISVTFTRYWVSMTGPVCEDADSPIVPRTMRVEESISSSIESFSSVTAPTLPASRSIGSKYAARRRNMSEAQPVQVNRHSAHSCFQTLAPADLRRVGPFGNTIAATHPFCAQFGHLGSPSPSSQSNRCNRMDSASNRLAAWH